MAPSTNSFNSDQPDHITSQKKQSNKDLPQNIADDQEYERVKGNQKQNGSQYEEDNWSETEMDRGEDQDFGSIDSVNYPENEDQKESI